MVFAYILGIFSGLAATTQGSVNGRVRSNVKSPYIASLLSFATAIAGMIIIVLATEHDLNIHRALIAEEPPWILTGGLCGTVIVTIGAVSIPVIGNALNMTLLCFGQIIAGLIIDHYGLFGAPEIAMSGRRFIGAVLAIIGVMLVSFEGSFRLPDILKPGGGGGRHAAGGRKAAAEKRDPGTGRYIVLSVVSGFTAALQVAVNGTLGEVLSSSSKATLISMTTGLISTLAIMLIIMFFGGGIMAIFSSPDGSEVTEADIENIHFHWLMLCGGPLAIGVVFSNAIAAPILGTGLVTITNIIGIMVSSLILDAVGFLGLVKKPVTARKIAGMALMTAATVLISLS